MRKIVFINATAAKRGGALSIIIQFLSYANNYNDKYDFYIFTSVKEKLAEFQNEHTKLIDKTDISNVFKRIWWDLSGLKQWSKSENIVADIVISFQNTGFNYYKSAKKIVYLHQSIPYYEYNWSFFNKEERVFWFYRHIYKTAMQLTWDKSTSIIVQTYWMKDKVSLNKNINKENVFVIMPDIAEVSCCNKLENFDKGYFNIIYPASSSKYKNHMDIIRALELIGSKDRVLLEQIKVYFTIDEECKSAQSWRQYCENRSIENINYIGMLKFDKLLEYYNSVDLMVFPSLMETVGLPILEFKKFNKPIVVKSAFYTKESLGNYKNSYIYNDVRELSDIICCLMDGKPLERTDIINNTYDTWDTFFESLAREKIYRGDLA